MSILCTISIVFGIPPLLNTMGQGSTFPETKSGSESAEREDRAILIGESDSVDDSEGGCREWTSANGKHTTTAKFISCLYPEIVLEQKDAVQITVPLQALTMRDQKLAFEIAGYDCGLPTVINVTWIKHYEAEFVRATDALLAMEKLFEKSQIDANSKLFLSSRLKTLKKAATDDLLRCFDEYETLESINSKRQEGSRKLDQILNQSIQVSDGQFVIDCLEQSTEIDPVSVEGLFLVGVFNMFCQGGNMKKAENAFEEVLTRCKLYESIFVDEDWTQRRVYAINNLAMMQIRDSKIRFAVTTLSGLTKEMAGQNLRIAANAKRLNWLSQNKGFRSSLSRGELQDIAKLMTTLESGTSVPIANGWSYLFPASVDPNLVHRMENQKLFIQGIQVGDDYISDPLCLNCKGSAFEGCNAIGCRLGLVKFVEQGYAGYGFNRGKATTVTEVACKVCSGSGSVECPCCDRGLQQPR